MTMKKLVIYTLISIVVLGGLKLSYDHYIDIKNDRDRLSKNIELLNSEVEITKALNGDLIFSNESLTVKNNELKQINSELDLDIKNMNLKVKNLQSIIKAYGNFTQTIDTVYVHVDSIYDNKYPFKFEDKFTKISGIFIADSVKPYVSNLSYSINSNLVIANEFQYKRRWIFWRKVVGVKVHITSENPNLNIDEIKSFQITK